MRQTLIGAAAAILLAGMAFAQEVLAPNPEIESTIQGQIDAFLQDDVDAAFAFASPGIQRLFGSPGNFGAMVRQGYPMVWRPEDVRFGDLRTGRDALVQRVIVTDAQGDTHHLEYSMQQQDGVWRIAGVRIVEAPGLSA